MAELLRLTDKIRLVAVPDGILISNVSSAAVSSVRLEDPAFQVLVRRLPSLISEGIFEETADGLLSTIEGLAGLEEDSHDPLEALFKWSPYTIRITATGAAGLDDFKLSPRFLMGKRLLPVRAIGVFIWRGKVVHRLRAAQATALRICDEFNHLEGEDKTKWRALHTIYQLQLLAKADPQIQLDQYLQSEEVVVPEKVALGADDNGRHATAFPRFEGVPEEAIKRQFLGISEVQEVYDLETEGGRKRVLLKPELQRVLRAVKKFGFGMHGKRRDNFYRNPRTILPEDEAFDPDLIDLIGYGPRVKGIGYPQFVRPLPNSTSENWFNQEPGEKRSSTKGRDGPFELECEFVDGERQKISLPNKVAVDNFISEAKAAIARGEDSFQWAGNNIPACPDLVASVETSFFFPKEKDGEGSDAKAERKGKSLLIHTNEEAQDYVEETAAGTDHVELKLPDSLLPGVKLKEHQLSGLHWLQNLIANDISKGALLADEMGLGKTLQLLSVGAWLIEHEFRDTLGKDNPPYDPILVVAPLILVENWAKELGQYFDVPFFQPIEILHGPTIKKYKQPQAGRELESATESLDLEQIRRNRLVITNYDTVKNYQYSFAKIPWSMVIVDEAQEIKEPSTAITHALKALNPMFRVASTGTPVETSLMNLWSIMDFVQPGNPLGSLSEFRKEFGNKEFDDASIGHELRRRLGFNRVDGLIKRRTKKEVLKDLPEKRFVIKEVILDPAHRSLYLETVKTVMDSPNPRGAALKGLQRLSMLSQHPFLIESNPFREDPEEYLKASAKLRGFLHTLDEIKGKGEKALVFTRSLAMQDILKIVIDRKFGLDTKIINGSSASRHRYVSNTRSGIIDGFSRTAGFNVLILSPEVAGVGLTITAANHVLHYGRWWNPAKENQATDRAYRIGQKKPVCVYHFLSKDPKGQFETFDEKLHRLLKSREELADNFLCPVASEAGVQDGLAGDIFSKSGEFVETNREARAATFFGTEDLQQLTPYEFEALAGLLVSKKFDRVRLTPKSRDGGVDAVGLSSTGLTLIQCKHRLGGGEANAEAAVMELIDGLDHYREHFIPKAMKALPVRLMLVMSGKADRETMKAAKDASVEVIDGPTIQKLLAKANLTKTDVKKFEDERVTRIEEAFQDIK